MPRKKVGSKRMRHRITERSIKALSSYKGSIMLRNLSSEENIGE